MQPSAGKHTKKVTAFVASARIKHTHDAVLVFLNHLQSMGDVETEFVRLHDYRLEYCRGCKVCFARGEEHCPLKDDRDLLVEKMMASRAMGTVMTHRAFGLRARDSLDAVCREVARLEGLLSRFLPSSDISRVNGWAGIRSEQVGLETFDVLSRAVQFSQACPGCFDVTIAPLVTLWKRGQAARVQPDEWSIKRGLSLVSYFDLILDPWDTTAGLRAIGQSVDLGGIGKGFAGDRIVEILETLGIASAYSNLGGNVVTVGARPDGSPWRIGIQHLRTSWTRRPAIRRNRA